MIEQVFALADRTGGEASCWLWQGPLFARGYPSFRSGGARSQYAHRLSLEWRIGRELSPKEFACHTCDTPACINPQHLWVGSHLDNIADKVRKGRHIRGERTHGAKLTEDSVRAIRIGISRGWPRKTLASMYGIGVEQVDKIVRRARWRHVA